jgi:hypothetical protein
MIKVFDKTKFFAKILITPVITTPIETEITSIYSSLIGPFVLEDNSISKEDSIVLWSVTNNYFFEI